jgi:hypothetical protein
MMISDVLGPRYESVSRTHLSGTRLLSVAVISLIRSLGEHRSETS